MLTCLRSTKSFKPAKPHSVHIAKRVTCRSYQYGRGESKTISPVRDCMASSFYDVTTPCSAKTNRIISTKSLFPLVNERTRIVQLLVPRTTRRRPHHLTHTSRRTFSTLSQHSPHNNQPSIPTGTTTTTTTTTLEDIKKWRNKDYDTVVAWANGIVDVQHANKLKIQEIDGPTLVEMEKKTQQELELMFVSHPINLPVGLPHYLPLALCGSICTQHITYTTTDLHQCFC